jgi:hypothetical protein
MKIRIAILIAMTGVFALAQADQAASAQLKKKPRSAARVTGCLPFTPCGHCRPLTPQQPVSVWVPEVCKGDTSVSGRARRANPRSRRPCAWQRPPGG